ncbi:MAG: hypothetical protein KDB69_07620 [Acidimicrobiia bacterium]|nr:hypothetical protein [Acidimicrobiia bacterium]
MRHELGHRVGEERSRSDRPPVFERMDEASGGPDVTERRTDLESVEVMDGTRDKGV